MTTLLDGVESLLGLGLFGNVPFEDKVYELGSSIDREGCCMGGALDVGGGGAEEGGDGARKESLCGALGGGGGGGGAAAGEACPAARIAACIARL